MNETSDPRHYQAIDPRDRTRQDSLELRLKDGRTYWLKHADRHLMALSGDGRALSIFFYSLSVVFRGRNLREVATAIDGRNVPWVQEFDPARWDRPTDGRTAFIESLELYQPRADSNPQDGPSAPTSKEKPDNGRR